MARSVSPAGPTCWSSRPSSTSRSRTRLRRPPRRRPRPEARAEGCASLAPPWRLRYSSAAPAQDARAWVHAALGLLEVAGEHRVARELAEEAGAGDADLELRPRGKLHAPQGGEADRPAGPPHHPPAAAAAGHDHAR